MFGGLPGYYEVTWDVYKKKDFWRLSFPVSFIFGEPNHFYLEHMKNTRFSGKGRQYKCYENL